MRNFMTCRQYGLIIIAMLWSMCTQSHFVLITSLYHEKQANRVQEYITCLERNLNHPDIELIHVFYDVLGDENPKSGPLWDFLTTHDRIVIEDVHGRPTFGNCFTAANELYAGKAVMISNADIYFNETLHLIKTLDLTNIFLALTRWNVTAKGGLAPFTGRRGSQYHGSQDTWIFQSPIAMNGDGIQIGMSHCDIYISYRALMSGFGVYNPCQSIQCCHLHLSNVRNYPSIGGPKKPFGLVPWCKIEQVGMKEYQVYVQR